MTDHTQARETDWREQGACRQTDPEIFYTYGAERAAKAFCQGCDVRDACLQDALRRAEPWGVWGGLDEKERRKLLRDSGLRPARSLGPCDLCGRTRYSRRYGDLLPEGGVWNQRVSSHAHKLCAECAGDDDSEESDTKDNAA